MNKIFSCIILIAFFQGVLFSQNAGNTPKIDEIRKNNYQVELGFRSIQNIYNNTAAATIMFKKKYNAGKLIDVKSIKFLRTYFTLNSNIKFGSDTIRRRQFSFESQNNVDVSFGIGIEKQFQNRRFVHFFGCDIFTNYYDGGQVYGISYNNFFNNYNVLYQLERTINPGVSPFLGMKYYFTDQLSIGIETGFSLGYYNSKFKNVMHSVDIINGQEIYNQTNYTSFIENGLKANFLGIRFITIGYSFN